MLVDVVADHQVDGRDLLGEAAKPGHELRKRVHVQPVVGIHHHEVQPQRVGDALVDALAVAAVALVDHADHVRVLRGVAVRDGGGAVGGAVVHQQYVRFVARLE